MDRDLGSAPYTGPAKSEPELLPCPFCGGTDLYWPHGTDPAVIKCGGQKGCGASSGVQDDEYGEQTPALAVAAWNRRALSPPAGGLFEAIAHGDEAHRAWLKEALHNYFAGKPVPPPRSSPPAGGDGVREALEREEIATLILRGVAELPDRTSPEDQPEMMLVTQDELFGIVCAALLSPTGENAADPGDGKIELEKPQ